MPSLSEVEKDYKKVIIDFLSMLKIFNNQITPLMFSDDTYINKIINQIKTSDSSAIEIGNALNIRPSGIGHWLNKLYKYNICRWEKYGKKKIWKLTKVGKRFVKLSEKIDYPKSRFVFVIRLINGISTADMASILNYSKEHYERIEKRGYPWSYRKSEKVLMKIVHLLPKVLNTKIDLIFHKLREWLIEREIQYVKSRGVNKPNNKRISLPLTLTEKKVIKILEGLKLKKNKDFFVHSEKRGYDIDIEIKKPKLFIEVVKVTSNSEKTYFLLESALKHLVAATKKISSRIVIIDTQNGSLSAECLELIKGKSIVFFLSPPLRIYPRYLELLKKARTISDIRKITNDPSETIRSRLKSLSKKGLVRRISKTTWKITKLGKEILFLQNTFLVTNGRFLIEKELLKRNKRFLTKLIKTKTKKNYTRTKDSFVEEIRKILISSRIPIDIQPEIKTRFGSKFPDIIITFRKKKFLIECVRTRKSALYTQVTRLAYKMKILKNYIKRKDKSRFVFIGLVSCYDSPLMFIPPNKPFKLLNEVCDKIFIDSNINEITNFIRGE